MKPEPTKSPSPRWCRVGLRASMLGLAALAATLAFWVNQARKERLAARWVEALGGHLTYEDQLDENGDFRKAVEGPVWRRLRRSLGDEYLRRIGRVEYVSEAERSIPPDELSHLSGLTGLRWLSLWCRAIDDRHLAQIGRMSRLEGLELKNAGLTDGGLRHLAGLHRLRSLDLQGTPITDAGLIHLRGLRALTYLDLSDTEITGPGLAHLAGLVRLESLHLNGTTVDDASLAFVADLARLDDLSLGWGVTDAGLRHLARLTNLKWLQFTNSRITGPGLDRLLPNLPELKYLGLNYTTVDLSDYNRISKRYPKLEIGLSY